ncbi:unnamed protein product [Closterium sp. Naga37s-1]|nr:unnamed protein product [Closterium sp. Naga37s-1]
MKGSAKVSRKTQEKKDEEIEQRELITAVDFTGLVAKDESKSKRGPKIISPLEDTWKPEKRMKSVNPEMEEIMGGPENKFDMGTAGSLPGGEGKENADGADEASGGVRYGATPKLLENNKKLIKPGETRGPKPDLVASVGPDGKVRHVKPISEKLVERVRPGPAKGKVMRIVEGRHEGLTGEVLEVVELGEGKGVQVRLVLVSSEEVIVVKGKEVADLGSWEEEQAMKRIRGEGAGDGEKRKVKENDHAGRRKALEMEEREEGERNRGRREGGREAEKRIEKEKDDGSVARDRDREREGGKDRERGGESDRHEGKERERERDRVNERDRIRDSDRDRNRDSERGDGRERRMDKEKSSRKEDKREQASTRHRAVREPSLSPPPPPRRRPWLMPHIRVRIVDKRIHGGGLYLKKGTIVDVVTPTTCDVLLDSGSSEAGERSGNGVSSRGNLVQGLKEKDMETALPKKGGRVMILRGANRGQVGKLLERRGEEGVAVVQLAESFALERLAMDDVAEYVGELGSYEG